MTTKTALGCILTTVSAKILPADSQTGITNGLERTGQLQGLKGRLTLMLMTPLSVLKSNQTYYSQL